MKTFSKTLNFRAIFRAFSKRPGHGKDIPEMSDFEKQMKKDIESQIVDPTEPFKIQPRNPNLMKDRPTKLNLKQFELVKETEFDNDPTLNRPKGVMDFLDPRVALKEGKLISLGKVVVTSADRTGFMFSLLELKGSVIVFPRMFFSWDVSDAADIRAHHFDIISLIKPSPSKFRSAGYIVIGTGPQFKELDPGAITKLKSFGVKFDVIDTVASLD